MPAPRAQAVLAGGADPVGQRVVRTLVACCATWVLAALALPGQAMAHAQLRETVPSQDATVARGVLDAELHFSERISVLPGAVRAFAPDGAASTVEEVTVRDRTVGFRIDADEPGTWAVAWRVVSADTHPVSGVLVFNADEATEDGAARERATESAKASSAAKAASGILGGLALAGLLVASGVVVARTRWFAGGGGIVRWLLATGGIAAVTGFVVDVAIATGGTVGGAFSSGAIVDQLQGTLGLAMFGVVAGLAAVAAADRLASRGRTRVATVLAGLGPAGLSAGSHALAAEAPWLRVPIDALHSVAAAVWVGGLVTLMMVLRRGDHATAASGLPRFSRAAAWCVTVLVGSGAYVTLVETGSWDALLNTPWGRLVLVKLGLVALAMPLAWRNRRNVQALPDDDSVALARMRRYVTGEVLLVMLVVVATAWLITQQPARQALDPGYQEAVESLAGGGSVQLLLDPARVGGNQLHVYALTEAGMPDSAWQDASVTASHEDLGIDNLEIEVAARGPGHWTAEAATIPQAGTWKFRVDLRRGKFDAVAAVASLPVAPQTS